MRGFVRRAGPGIGSQAPVVDAWNAQPSRKYNRV